MTGEARAKGGPVIARPEVRDRGRCPVCAGEALRRRRVRVDGGLMHFYRHERGQGRDWPRRHGPTSPGLTRSSAWTYPISQRWIAIQQRRRAPLCSKASLDQDRRGRRRPRRLKRGTMAGWVRRVQSDTRSAPTIWRCPSYVGASQDRQARGNTLYALWRQRHEKNLTNATKRV